MKKIILGSDKSGFTVKEAIKKHLQEQGWEVCDCGTLDTEKPMPFFKVAPVASAAIQKKEYEKGILICGTGMGMAIVANKFEGIYAACCESVYAAEKCRAINNANMLTMGGWIVNNEMGIEMVEKFLNTNFTENLEEWRQEFLKKAEQEVQIIEKEIYHS